MDKLLKIVGVLICGAVCVFSIAGASNDQFTIGDQLNQENANRKTKTNSGTTQGSTSTSTNKNGNRSIFGNTPDEILHNIVKDANAGGDPIQDTALNSVSRTQGSHPSKYRLANTFDSIRKRSGIYLDRLFYIGLSVAVILIIRNGLQLVIGKDINDVRKPLTNVVVGVAILTGVYVIIKLITSLVALIFNL